jgi:hypothetical protein
MSAKSARTDPGSHDRSVPCGAALNVGPCQFGTLGNWSPCAARARAGAADAPSWRPVGAGPPSMVDRASTHRSARSDTDPLGSIWTEASHLLSSPRRRELSNTSAKAGSNGRYVST